MVKSIFIQVYLNMNSSKIKYIVYLLNLIILSFFSINAYSQPVIRNCIIMQTAEDGYLYKNGTGYQLTLSNPNPWLVYFKHSPTQHLIASRNAIIKNQLYNAMQQSLKNSQKQSLMAEIVSFDAKNQASHYDALINGINYNKLNDQITYKLKLTIDPKMAALSKLPLKHIVILIDGNDVYINCGGPG